jgi:Uncharacterised nucleotidyltransferase
VVGRAMITRRVHPFDVIARVLAERLQGRLPSAGLRDIVHSRSVDWERVVGYASAQFVLPAFAAALRDLGLTESLDQQLVAFLDAVHAANEERNNELRDELATAVSVLNRIGVEPVLLKGAIRLCDGLYPDHGWRMLRDLDLLVPEAMLTEAIRTFGEAGYAPCALHDEVRRKEGACQIDLHIELFSGSTQLRLLRAEEISNETCSFALKGGRVRIPSVEHQFVHLIGHSQIRHCGHAIGWISLRDLLEAAALVRWGHETIDWQAVTERFVAAGYQRPLLSLLLALNDGGWCAVQVTDKIGALAALQQRRIALQARSTTLAYIGSRAGWLVSEFKRQINERDAGELRAIKNLKRLISERRAIPRMARAFWQRRLVHALPHLSWLVAQ